MRFTGARIHTNHFNEALALRLAFAPDIGQEWFTQMEFLANTPAESVVEILFNTAMAIEAQLAAEAEKVPDA